MAKFDSASALIRHDKIKDGTESVKFPWLSVIGDGIHLTSKFVITQPKEPRGTYNSFSTTLVADLVNE